MNAGRIAPDLIPLNFMIWCNIKLDIGSYIELKYYRVVRIVI